MVYPTTYKAIKVSQPFGDFLVISIKAVDLLELSFSDTLRYDENGKLRGSQRELDEKTRVREIADYINGNDLAFPNSIIIAANYNKDGFLEDDENLRWSFEKIDGELYEIKIPSNKPLAAIIDGQHRLNGFITATTDRKEQTDLLVVVYFDLPTPYQAYLFASINYNQKPVSKNVALEQFGYLTDLTPQETWSPELLGVFLSKSLNIDKDSMFYNHIKVAPQNDEFLLELDQSQLPWLVSTSTVVDGIVRLISTNPKRDANSLNTYSISERKRRLLVNDKSPLRSFYLDNNDLFIYKTINNFFSVVSDEIFVGTQNNSYIKKTVGIQALFAILKTILTEYLNNDKDISKDYFKGFIEKFKNIDFSDNFFTASGLGKSRIQNIILLKLQLKSPQDIRNQDELVDYKRLLK
jgi:DNA phosphorothioation-associated DGQHR protein 1